MIGKPTRLLLASLSILMSTGAWADFTATPTEARAIAKEAYLYGYPVVEMYKTLYTQAVDKKSPNFKAPLNQIGNTAKAFTAKDTAFVTPNTTMKDRMAIAAPIASFAVRRFAENIILPP